MTQLPWLADDDIWFPETSFAFEEPNGLLAAGGDLSEERLLAAYQRGIFPWYSDDQPILWWSPAPRMILDPSELHTGRSSRKLLNKNLFTISFDQAFEDVIHACAHISRSGESGTWITEEMQNAYINLHNNGHAHSAEAWQGNTLVGGLYGLAIGGAFFGESMFSAKSGASRVAFITLAKHLAKQGFSLIDCQMYTDYLSSFGGKEVSRQTFEEKLKRAVSQHTIRFT